MTRLGRVAASLAVRGLRSTRHDGRRRFELIARELSLGATARTALVGPTGCGKSSLLEVLSLARRPAAVQSFTITEAPSGHLADIGAAWRRRDDTALTRLRGRLFGYVPQSGGLLAALTVGDNIALPLRLNGRRAVARVAALAERLSIGDVLRAYPKDLSVGQARRVAIARALAHEPAIVVADEPTAALDAATAEDVMALMTAAAEDGGAGLLVATHDRDLAARFGFRFVEAEMDRGFDLDGVAWRSTRFAAAAEE